MKRPLLSVVFTLVAVSSAAHAAEDKNETKNQNENAGQNENAPPTASPRDGLRFRAGLFGVAHARDATRDGDGTSMGVAPGLSLGPSYTSRNWDFSFDLRGAMKVGHPDHAGFDDRMPGTVGDSRVVESTTVLFSGGPRARWFALDGSLAPFFSGGIDALLFYTENLAGVGASLHLGTGLEVMHDDAHGRLALELGIDVPTFRMKRGSEAELDAWSPSGKRHYLYVVPVTLAANWTF